MAKRYIGTAVFIISSSVLILFLKSSPAGRYTSAVHEFDSFANLTLDVTSQTSTLRKRITNIPKLLVDHQWSSESHEFFGKERKSGFGVINTASNPVYTGGKTPPVIIYHCMPLASKCSLSSVKTYFQNPKNCSLAKKLVCKISDRPCGFGCQFHHLNWCLMVAYGTERTLILGSKKWRYAKDGWESVFKPLSKSCTSISPGEKMVTWPGYDESKDIPVVYLPVINKAVNLPPFLPLTYPEDIASRLQNVTSDPGVWFVGQLAKYLMRPQLFLEEHLLNRTQELRFENPVVGIQVRRTDKVGTEADYHGIEEYMKFAERWFSKKENQTDTALTRRVYIATDDPSVLSEATKRLPYEIMFTKHANASHMVQSLDYVFFMEGKGDSLWKSRAAEYPIYPEVT